MASTLKHTNQTEHKLIQIIPGYLGNKNNVISEIKKLIDSITDKGTKVLDLFGGSNIVGVALKKDYIIYSNDIQKYSHIIAKVLLEHIPNEILDRLSADRIFNKTYVFNYAQLKSIFSEALQKERDILNNKSLEEFASFVTGTPNYNHIPQKVAKEFNGTLNQFSEARLKIFKKNNKSRPYSLFTLFFSNSYFGLNQCLEIDSIRYSIDQLSNLPLEEDKEKLIYLVCLLYALYVTVSSVGGHFAQPQQFTNSKSILKVMNKHTLSIRDLFLHKLCELKNKLGQANRHNRAFNSEYRDLLGSQSFFENFAKDIAVVYIDPPYTIDHYSRFYHILETLIKYDYPASIGKGRYRTDRKQSNFCIKSKALSEFDMMLCALSKTSAKIVMSYTDTYRALLSREQILNICNKYYKRASVIKTIKYDYSNLGQKSINSGNELLFLCEN